MTFVVLLVAKQLPSHCTQIRYLANQLVIKQMKVLANCRVQNSTMFHVLPKINVPSFIAILGRASSAMSELVDILLFTIL